MALSSAAASELLNAAVANVHFKEYSMIPMIHPQVVNVETSERAYEEAFRVSGIGSFVLKPEGTPVSYDEPLVGDRMRTLNATYALGIRLPMELIEDDQFGIVMRMPQDLGESARDHQERLAFAPFNDAFTGTTFTGMPEGDGTRRSLCNTGHVPMKAGGTRSNRLAPGVALSTTAIRDMVTIMELTTNEEGRQIRLEPAVVLVHPNNRWTAEVIFETTQEPGTTNNDINPSTQSRLGVRTVRSPYLTDTDGFFLLSAKRRHSVMMVRRKGVTLDRGNDMDTFDRKFTGHYRAHAKFESDFGVVGSAPGT
jgi:hypothetical protein